MSSTMQDAGLLQQATPPATKTPRVRSRSSSVASASAINAPLGISGVSRRPMDELSAFLEQHGYKIIRGTYIGSGNNATLSFIKASYLGQPVYIDLDRDFASVSPLEKDLSVVEILPGEESELYNNEWAERCTSVDCGTMVECADGFCAIKRNPVNGFVHRTSYVLTTKPTQRVVQSTEDIFAYPVVAISEIMTNPASVAASIKRHTIRLRAKAMKQYVDLRNETIAMVDTLANIHHRLDHTLSKAQDTIEDQYIDVWSAIDGRRGEDTSTLVRQFEVIEAERETLYRDVSFLNQINEDLENVITQLAAMNRDIVKRVVNYPALGLEDD